MRLTKDEKETIVNFNEASEEADVFTYRKDWQRKLEALGYKPDFMNRYGGKGYTVPKSLVIKPPRKPKRMTKKQKQELRERLYQTSFLSLKMPCAVGILGGGNV